MPPARYAEYHGITEEEEHEKTNMLKLLIKAPKAFWTIGLVQFFCCLPLCSCGPIPAAASLPMVADDAPTVEHLVDGVTKVVLDTRAQYQNAADWVGVLFAMQAIGSVL